MTRTDEQLVLMEIVDQLRVVELTLDQIPDAVDQGKVEAARGLVQTIKKAVKDSITNLIDTFWSRTSKPPQLPDVFLYLEPMEDLRLPREQLRLQL